MQSHVGIFGYLYGAEGICADGLHHICGRKQGEGRGNAVLLYIDSSGSRYSGCSGCYTHAYTYTDTHAYANPYAHANPYSNVGRKRYTYGFVIHTAYGTADHAVAHAHAYADADSDADSVRAGQVHINGSSGC